MFNMVGGDTPGMRNLANKLEQISQRLNEMQQQIGSELGSVEWLGNDATRYRQQWDGEFAPSMLSAARDLGQAATQMRADAADQDRASGQGG